MSCSLRDIVMPVRQPMLYYKKVKLNSRNFLMYIFNKIPSALRLVALKIVKVPLGDKI